MTSQKIINILFLISLLANVYFVAFNGSDVLIDSEGLTKLETAYSDTRKKQAKKDSISFNIIDSIGLAADKKDKYILYLERKRRNDKKKYSNFNDSDRVKHLDSIFSNNSKR